MRGSAPVAVSESGATLTTATPATGSGISLIVPSAATPISSRPSRRSRRSRATPEPLRPAGARSICGDPAPRPRAPGSRLRDAGRAQFVPGRAPGFRPGFQFIGGAGGFPSPGAVVDYDFAKDRYSGPAISVSRASSAYIDDSAGNWTLVPANTLRRSDKGALIEGAQTNSIRNNSMQGRLRGHRAHCRRIGHLPQALTASLGRSLA